MSATYQFLYSTIRVEGRTYLPSQMDEQVWRLVYGYPTPDRQRCWGKEALQYKRKSGSVDTYDPPTRVYNSPTQRSYEFQSDGFFCGGHSLNNVANAVVLSPPAMLSAIELVRTLGSMEASFSELMLAALREGIFLLPIELNHVWNLNSFDPEAKYPEDKCCLSLLELARGMVIFDGGGHFVSLIYTTSTDPASPISIPEADPASPISIPEGRHWVVFDSLSEAVAAGKTAAAALDQYILGRLKVGMSESNTTRLKAGMGEPNTTREARRRLLGMNLVHTQFVGLMPISLYSLHQDAHRRAKEVGSQLKTLEIGLGDYAHLVMLRTILRRSLSEMRTVNSDEKNADIELFIPSPASPNSIDELCWIIKQQASTGEDGKDWSGSLIDGFDQTNIASFTMIRFAVDARLNVLAEDLAGIVMREYQLGWPAHFVIREERSNKKGAKTLVRTATEFDEINLIVKQVRSLLYDATEGLGLLLTGSSSVDSTVPHPESFDKFVTIMSNRRWLRYIVLYLAATGLLNAINRIVTDATNFIGEDIDETEYRLGSEVQKLLVLFCTVAYSNLVGNGVKLEATAAMRAMFGAVQTERASLLPLDSVPPALADLVINQEIKNVGMFARFFLGGCIEWYVWLLQAVINVKNTDIELPSLAPLLAFDRPNDLVYDNLTRSYDVSAKFITLLRTSLFQMPMSDGDQTDIEESYFAQNPKEPTRLHIQEHFASVGVMFVTNALTDKFVASVEEANSWIDVLAFDSGYANITDDDYSALTARRAETHDLSDKRPRFIEKAAQSGFDTIRRRVFGELRLEPDDRTPISNNIAQLPLPNPAGVWTSTLPRRYNPCTVPLAALGYKKNRAVSSTTARRLAGISTSTPMTAATTTGMVKKRGAPPF